jgi:hypothetical protein
MTSDCRLSQQCPEGTHPVRVKVRVCAVTVRAGSRARWGDHQDSQRQDPGLLPVTRPATVLVRAKL